MLNSLANGHILSALWKYFRLSPVLEASDVLSIFWNESTFLS